MFSIFYLKRINLSPRFLADQIVAVCNPSLTLFQGWLISSELPWVYLCQTLNNEAMKLTTDYWVELGTFLSILMHFF